jgi:hypothetical protein
MNDKKGPAKGISGALSAFEKNIQANGTNQSGSCLASRFSRPSTDLRKSIVKNKELVKERKAVEEANTPAVPSNVRTPWQNSNLALVNSDLARQIREAASDLEPAWHQIDPSIEALYVWRIENFHVVTWPKEQYGSFHTGDSYIVLKSFRRGLSASMYFDVHIWIGTESSQDEYGTAAYKMVEVDDFLGGVAVQHRQVQGHESEVSSFGFWANGNEFTIFEISASRNP